MALGNDYARPVVGSLAGCIAATIAIYSYGGQSALSQFLLSAGFLPQPSRFSLLFVVAGFAAGSAYWLVAGKYAGADCPASSAST
ncbi:hypothetical protein [Bradyrhizobium sp.]|jgi:high-affinity Fe2+/Pb2+ permease|uniref:hypothetical protein n=1 Tax=Bradyrhizobium sp. TaxID=376 RepID=UPI003C1A3638